MGEAERRSVGSIQLRERLGSNGLYLADQPGLGRRVVVRKLRRDLLANSSLVASLEREGRLGASVLHPNVVAVFDFFSLHGDQYLVMEHVDGLSLRAALLQTRRISPELASLLLGQVALGAAALHDRGILHTDLRPENVLVSRWGEVKLCGLGAARETSEGQRPLEEEPTAYTSPELRVGGKLGPSCDVYALGMLLGEMLTGNAGHDWTRRPPYVPVALARLVRRCVNPDAARRPSIAQVSARLARFARRGNASGCSAEIAAWLWEISRSAEKRDGAAKAVDGQAARPRATRRGPALAASALALLCAATWLALAPRSDSGSLGRPPVDAGVPPQTGALFADLDRTLAQRPASIRFTAFPWAEVWIDDDEPFLTPRAEPVALAPGSHEIAFRHPRYGEFRATFRFEPGEERVLRHVFDAAGSP